MDESFKNLLAGYHAFRKKYAVGEAPKMADLSERGQRPQTMIVACSDSRVDPALILQCDPGDLFVVRNVASIVPSFKQDGTHHGTSAALEFGVRFLGVKHLIIIGHSQCGGIQGLLNPPSVTPNDFITDWVSVVKPEQGELPSDMTVESAVKFSLQQSYKNCLTFPWIKQKVESEELDIHLWFFDIETGRVFTYSQANQSYEPL